MGEEASSGEAAPKATPVNVAFLFQRLLQDICYPQTTCSVCSRISSQCETESLNGVFVPKPLAQSHL